MTSRRFESILMSLVPLSRQTSNRYPEYRTKCEPTQAQLYIWPSTKLKSSFVLTSRNTLVYHLIVTWFKIGP